MKKSIFALICLFCLINVTTAFASKSPKTSVIIGFKSSINPKTIVSVGGVIKKALKNIPIITADLTDEQIDLLKRIQILNMSRKMVNGHMHPKYILGE